MKWFLAKLVYRIICGDGDHTAQFDEQLRLIAAADEKEGLLRAADIGRAEEDNFYNHKEQLVRWQFIGVPELYPLNELTDGAELYSRVKEVDDAMSYVTFVQNKAQQLREVSSYAN